MTALGLFIAAGILLIAAVLLIVGSRRALNRAAEMAATDTSAVGSLNEAAAAVAQEIGSGSFAQRVEIKGLLRSREPLAAELSHERCGRFRTVVKRKYEETVEERDSQGRLVRRNRTGEDTVSELSRSAACFVEDKTGCIDLDLEAADVDLKKVVDRFEPGEHATGAAGLVHAIAQAALGWPAGRRTLGYQYQEWVLPLDRPIYVLGEACDEGGRLRIRKGAGGLRVSLKSEEELTAEARRLSRGTRAGAMACAVAAAAALVWGVIEAIRG